MEANDPEYIRYITAWIPVSATALGCVLVAFGDAPDYKPDKNNDDAELNLIDDFVE